MRPEPIPALTSLRFFAALLVVFFHFGQGVDWPPIVLQFIKSGHVGVPFFFILSGYVLAYNYADKLGDWRSFYWARFTRIYPLYAISLIIAAPFFFMAVAKEHGNREGLLALGQHAPARFAMVQAWFKDVTSWNPPAWSLSVEAFFYALFPLLVKIPGHLLLAGISAGLYYRIQEYNPPTPILCLPLFVTGICLAKAKVKAPPYLLPVAVVLTFALLVFLVPLDKRVEATPGIVALVFGLLVWSAAGSHSKLLAQPSLILLGEASYALYILHHPIAAGFQAIGKRIGGVSFDSPAYFALYVVAVVGLSVLAYQYVERPLIKKLRPLVNRKRVKPEGAAVPLLP